MKNIHILPTDKPSRLFRSELTNNLGLDEKSTIRGGRLNNQHIYIISDEEIKVGDVVKIPCGVGKVKELIWKFGNDFPSYIVEDVFVYKLRYGQKNNELETNSFRYEDVSKIILTTDQNLINDGIEQISEDTLLKIVEHINSGKNIESFDKL